MEPGAEKILIVDDDRDFAFLLSHLLHQAGYQTHTANDGIEALCHVEQDPPDLVLLDVMMPRMDGWHTLRKIRAFSSVPVIILSARQSELDTVRGLELGADDYIVKPPAHAEFLARIRAALRRKHHPIVTNPIVHVDDRLVVDRTRQEAYVHGQPAGLSAIEYNLLSCLLDNAGHICSRHTLLVQVWGWQYAEQLDYLKVYIHHLRRKIEHDPANPRYILTERGKGYRFVDGWREP